MRWRVWIIAGWLVLTAAVFWAGRWALPERPPATGLAPLPSALAAPRLWTPTVAQAPPGAVPIVAGGPSTALRDILGGNESVVVFGTGRVLDVPYTGTATPGETLLLSPDGTRAAHAQPQGIGADVLNLLDGTTTTVPGSEREGAGPIAWAPDGRTLLAARYPSRDDGGTVGLLDTVTGAFAPLLGVGDATLLLGAFRPDGAVAVQAGDRLCVFAGGRQESCFRPPAGARLAGKGAWTPDGRSLALVADHGRTSDLTVVSSATGDPTGPATFPVAGVTTVRLLGWWPDGRAVLAAYRPEPDAPAELDPSSYDNAPTNFAVVRQVSLLAVAPSGAAEELVAVAEDDLLAVDVADAALAAGRVGPPVDAPLWPARPGALAAMTALVLLVPAALLLRRR